VPPAELLGAAQLEASQVQLKAGNIMILAVHTHAAPQLTQQERGHQQQGQQQRVMMGARHGRL
jgi:hypothetical protein